MRAPIFLWHGVTHNVRYYEILSEISKFNVHRKSWCKKNTITCGQVVDVMAATRMRFYGTGNSTKYIDLAKALSLQNRKLHRQKMIYTVYGGYYVDSNGSRINLNVAPNTWPVKRAINRGFAQWRKMIAKTLANTDGLTTGKYSDFKIFLDNQHGTTPLVPVDAGDTNMYSSSPEWDYSTLTTEDPDQDPNNSPDQFELMVVGPHVHNGLQGNARLYTRVGLLQSWVESRAKPQMEEPNVDNANVKIDPLSNLFDAGDADDDRIEIINQEGDRPPYDLDDMFGNAAGSGGSNNLQRVSSAITTTANAIMPIHGFEALCGLIQLDFGTADPGSWELVLDVESNGVKF